jgi:hypothetical protein
MDKIAKISPEIDPKVDEVKLTKAEEAHKEILARTAITAGNLLELGKLFRQVRNEKLYKLLGAETFGEYIGYPEISFGRSTIYSFIHVYELFVLKLECNPEVLSKIGHRRLQIISPVVNKDGTEDEKWYDATFWLDNAEVLSESDLINAVRGFQGKPDMTPKPKEVENVHPFDFKDYLDFVKAHPCVICEEEIVDLAHFPRSKGAGGNDTHQIPLCRRHHTEQHQDPFDFLWLHKDKIFSYFYDTFLKCFELIRSKE